MKPGKPEKIRFGQAPRESLPTSQVASAAAPDAGPSVTTPENRYVNPDGTVSNSIDAAPEKKTRLSARPPVKKVKTPKNSDTPDQPTPEEQASQKVQNAPMGLTDPDAAKKPKQKAAKTRYSATQKQPDETPALSRQTVAGPAGCSRRQASRPYPAHRLPILRAPRHNLKSGRNERNLRRGRSQVRKSGSDRFFRRDIEAVAQPKRWRAVYGGYAR